MNSPLNRTTMALRYIGLIGLLVVALSVACSKGHDDGHSHDWMMVSSLWPGWDAKEMIGQSDAIVVGVVSEALATKQEAGGLEDPPRFYYEFKDFALTVEEVLYPEKNELPARIAILAETGIASADAGVAVAPTNDLPQFNIGERVLVFLDSLEDPEYADGVGRPVPKGYAASDYFQVVISAKYGKLTLEDGEWKDDRSKEGFTAARLKKIIEEVAVAQ